MATSVDLISHGAGEGINYCLNAMAALFMEVNIRLSAA